VVWSDTSDMLNRINRYWISYFLILAIVFPIVRCVQQNRDSIDNIVCIMLSLVVAGTCLTMNCRSVRSQPEDKKEPKSEPKSMFDTVIPSYMGVLSVMTFMCLSYASHTSMVTQPFSNVYSVTPIILPILMIPVIVQVSNLSVNGYILEVCEFVARIILTLAVIVDVMNTDINDI
jgi:hypothetical protein